MSWITRFSQNTYDGRGIHAANDGHLISVQVNSYLIDACNRMQRRIDVFDTRAATHTFDIQINSAHYVIPFKSPQ